MAKLFYQFYIILEIVIKFFKLTIFPMFKNICIQNASIKFDNHINNQINSSLKERCLTFVISHT